MLAQSQKDCGMGKAGQGRMSLHRQKKLDREDLVAFRKRVALQADGQEMKMTMVLVRMLTALPKDGALGPRNLQPTHAPEGPAGGRVRLVGSGTRSCAR